MSNFDGSNWHITSASCTSWFDGGMGGFGAGFSGGDELDKKNPCDRMARRAQKVANEALEWAEKNKKTMKEALSMFDRSFTPYYIGEIWSGDNVSYFRKTGGGVPTSKRIPGEWGQADFKEEYLDAEATRYAPATDNNGTPVNNLVSDQVHHFVGYMSAGINGAYWSSTAHEITDWWGDNPGDVALGEAAYNIGKSLTSDPSTSLKSIGKTIKDKICR
jgi:hypothetical protein